MKCAPRFSHGTHTVQSDVSKEVVVGVVFLGIVAVALPVAAFAIEWSGDTGLSERHHSHHDTYFVPRSLTTSLVLMMLFAGTLGVVVGWLCSVGVFAASPLVVFSFFCTFVAVSFAMWLAIRRYCVVTYADRLRVTPFVGAPKTVMYAEIDRMVWQQRSATTGYRNLRIYAGQTEVFLWGIIDLEQILGRIDRFDVLEAGGDAA